MSEQPAPRIAGPQVAAAVDELAQRGEALP